MEKHIIEIFIPKLNFLITQYERDRELSAKIENLPAHVKEFVLSYDPELMDMFTRLNEKFVRLKKNNTE